MEETKETLAQKALRLLSEIPADKFITGDFSDGKGNCCALGHYKRLTSNNPDDYSKENCNDLTSRESKLRVLSSQFLYKKHELVADLADVNNTEKVNGYVEADIKERVIHCLTDMVKEGC